ncbi:hypothetical protein [Tsukamurella pulmonis]|uniref:hypothetical protein n=1 Tax=Tsukamurella pulmonis TaxID=47312 RepID=UPI001058E2F7|nr:hypothetical protein [Tsukamurella pulmonis]
MISGDLVQGSRRHSNRRVWWAYGLRWSEFVQSLAERHTGRAANVARMRALCSGFNGGAPSAAFAPAARISSRVITGRR